MITNNGQTGPLTCFTVYDVRGELSCGCGDWCFNLRKSNTEPLARLNLKARGNAGGLEERIVELSAVIVG